MLFKFMCNQTTWYGYVSYVILVGLIYALVVSAVITAEGYKKLGECACGVAYQTTSCPPLMILPGQPLSTVNASAH